MGCGSSQQAAPRADAPTPVVPGESQPAAAAPAAFDRSIFCKYVFNAMDLDGDGVVNLSAPSHAPSRGTELT